MSVNEGENVAKSIFAISPPRRSLKMKKANVRNAPVSVNGENLIRCKQISSLQEVKDEEKEKSFGENSSSDVELTVISSDESTLVVRHLSNSESNDNIGEPSVKRSKTNYVYESYLSNSKQLNQVSVDQNHVARRGRTSFQNEDLDYIPVGNKSSKCTSQDPDRRQSKYKVFRDEWLDIDIFRDWLDRDPGNPRKARCLACNTTMNAGKSELEKHAVGARHERALEIMHQTMMLQQLTETEMEGNDRGEDVGVDDDSFCGSSRSVDPGLHSTSEHHVIEQSVHPEESLGWQEQHIEALNRVTAAVESFSSTVTSLLECLTAQQRELLQVLRDIHKK